MNKKSSQPIKIIGLIIFTLICLHTIASSVSGWVDDNNTIYSTTGGRVGIGTSNPTNLFHVYEGSGTAYLNIEGGAGANARLLFSDGGTTKWNLGYNAALGSLNVWDPVNSVSPFQIYGNSNADTLVLKEGKVGIGTDDPDTKLTVAGTVHARKVIVDSTAGADFVFEDDYDLAPLAEVESFIEENHHLPEIPPAQEMIAHGIEVAEMNVKLLQKIEELTLYIIEQEKEMTKLKKRMADIEEEKAGQ